MKILIVEDDGLRITQFMRWLRGHDLAVATTAAEAKRLLRWRRFDAVFLDHDLGGVFADTPDRNTGAEVAKYMVRRRLRLPCIIHTHNPAGAEYMRSMLPHARVVPFGDELAQLAHDLLWEVQDDESGGE